MDEGAACSEEAARPCDAIGGHAVDCSNSVPREGVDTGDCAARRADRRTREDGRLTPSQERLLGFIASRCVADGSVALTKRELADRMGCCVRTVDRAVTRLRAEGYVEVHELYGADGAQVANEYCLATRA